MPNDSPVEHNAYYWVIVYLPGKRINLKIVAVRRSVITLPNLGKLDAIFYKHTGRIPCSRRPKLGWLLFWLFHYLPNLAWADGNLAEAAEQLGQIMSIQSKSTQPRSTTTWDALYSHSTWLSFPMSMRIPFRWSELRSSSQVFRHA